MKINRNEALLINISNGKYLEKNGLKKFTFKKGNMTIDTGLGYSILTYRGRTLFVADVDISADESKYNFLVKTKIINGRKIIVFGKFKGCIQTDIFILIFLAIMEQVRGRLA